VARIRKKSHRVPDYAVGGLKADKGDVQARANGEGQPEILRIRLVVVAVMVIMSVHCFDFSCSPGSK
jgi:hypothetical protein